MRKYQTQNLDDLDIDIQMPEELDEDAVQKLFVRWALKPLEWMGYFFPHHFSLPSPPFHKEIADNFILRPDQLQAYEAPRGSAKTTLLEFLTLHSAIFHKTLFTMFISLTEDIAAQRIVTIRHECEHNKLLKLFFGDLRTDKWGEKELILRNDKMGIHNKILARGLGQQVLGIKYLHKRPQRIIIDDPEDARTAENPKNVDKDERWFKKEVVPGMDKDDGKLIMITTPVTSGCLIERIKTSPRVFFKRYSIKTRQGIPLWKEWMDSRAIQELKEQLEAEGNLSYFYTEYLCNPLDPDTHSFTEEMFEYVPYPENMEKWLEDKYIFFLVDLAIGERKRNAYSAVVVIAVDCTDMWWVVDEYQVKADWEIFANDLYGLRDKWDINNRLMDVGIEEAGQQKGFWNVLSLVAEKKGYKPIYAVSVRPEKDKDARSAKLLPRFRHRKIRFFPNVRRTKEQLILIPDGQYRDLADCIAYGENLCHGPGGGKVAESPTPSWSKMRAATDEELDREYRESIAKQKDIDWELDIDLED